MTVQILTFQKNGENLSIAEATDFPNAAYLNGNIRAVFDSVRMNAAPDDVIILDIRLKNGSGHRARVQASRLRTSTRTPN